MDKENMRKDAKEVDRACLRRARTPAENCARLKDLGYVASTHIAMYGERFELISDPIQEGDCIVVQVLSGNDPTIRRLQLPVSVFLGLSDRGGQQQTKFGKRRR